MIINQVGTTMVNAFNPIPYSCVPMAETRYKHETMVDGEPVIFEICDTCPKVRIGESLIVNRQFHLLQTLTELPNNETIFWADGFILVYSITDRNSFNFVKLIKQHILDVRSQQQQQQLQIQNSGNSGNSVGNVQINTVPIVLLGNKCDMVHLRQVATEEGIV